MSCEIKVRPIEKSNSISCSSADSNPSTETKNLSKNFIWSLKPLTRFMYLIGVPLPLTDDKSSRPWRKLLTAVFFVVVVLIHLWLVVHVSLHARDISVSYASRVSSSATSWNFIIDNLNWAMYIVGGHSFLLFLTKPEIWKDLSDSFKSLEGNLAKLDIYPQCRRVTVHLLTYNVVSVRLLVICRNRKE